MAPSTKEPTPAPRMATALLEAQKSLRVVKKDATNDFHRYAYASAEEMIHECRNALHAQALVAERRGWEIVRDPANPADPGTIVSGMRLTHAPTGEFVVTSTVWPIVPEKGRPIDKAIAASLTSSLSYWLRDLLMVPREDESMDKRDDRAYEPPKPTQAIPAATKPQEAPKAKVKPEQPAAAPEAPSDAPDAALSPVSPYRKQLDAIMRRDGFTVDEVEKCAVLNQMVPAGTPIDKFNDQTLSRFIQNWDRVRTVIESKIRS